MGAFESFPEADSFEPFRSFVVHSLSQKCDARVQPSIDDIVLACETVIEGMDTAEAKALLVTLLENDGGTQSAEIFGITEYATEGHRSLSPSEQAFARVGALKLSLVRDVCDLLMPTK